MLPQGNGNLQRGDKARQNESKDASKRKKESSRSPVNINVQATQSAFGRLPSLPTTGRTYNYQQTVMPARVSPILPVHQNTRVSPIMPTRVSPINIGSPIASVKRRAGSDTSPTWQIGLGHQSTPVAPPKLSKPDTTAAAYQHMVSRLQRQGPSSSNNEPSCSLVSIRSEKVKNVSQRISPTNNASPSFNAMLPRIQQPPQDQIPPLITASVRSTDNPSRFRSIARPPLQVIHSTPVAKKAPLEPKKSGSLNLESAISQGEHSAITDSWVQQTAALVDSNVMDPSSVHGAHINRTGTILPLSQQPAIGETTPPESFITVGDYKDDYATNMDTSKAFDIDALPKLPYFDHLFDPKPIDNRRSPCRESPNSQSGRSSIRRTPPICMNPGRQKDTPSTTSSTQKINSSSTTFNSGTSTATTPPAQQQLGALAASFVEKLCKTKQRDEKFTLQDAMIKQCGGENPSTQRRLYDIINILEGLSWVTRDQRHKKTYFWKGNEGFLDLLRSQRRSEEEIDRYRPIAPIEGHTKIDHSLPTLTKNFIGLLFCRKDLEIDLTTVSELLLPPLDSKSQSKLRRFYDIANVLVGLGLVEKAGKKSYRWIFERESLLRICEKIDDTLDISEQSLLNSTTTTANVTATTINDSGLIVSPKSKSKPLSEANVTSPSKRSPRKNIPNSMRILCEAVNQKITEEVVHFENGSKEPVTPIKHGLSTAILQSPAVSPKLHKLIQTSPWLLDHLIEARIKERQIQERENRDRIEAAKRRVEF